MDADRFERVEIRAPDDLWRWLEAHHGQAESVWLVTWKASDRARYVSRDQVLDALIAYGWIDGRRMKLDAARTMQLISPRHQQAWAESYRARAAKLEVAGRMCAPGRAALERAKASGQWDAHAAADALADPEDLVAALAAVTALPWWRGAAPSYRRNILRWIGSAKRPETRAKRIGIAVAHAARGEKVPQY